MTTKVAFVKDKVDGETIAVFPTELHSWHGSDVVMYVHHGQHTSGDLQWAKEQDDPTLEEITPLLNELVHIVGYKDLEIVKL